MKFPDFQQSFAGNHAVYAEYAVLLVDVDTVPSDGVDVIISPLGQVGIHPDDRQMVLSSVAANADPTLPPVSLFETFVNSWPMPHHQPNEFTVMMQLPIAPQEQGDQPWQLAPLAGVWISREEQEIWLLVRPQSEYPQDILPA